MTVIIARLQMAVTASFCVMRMLRRQIRRIRSTTTVGIKVSILERLSLGAKELTKEIGADVKEIDYPDQL